MSRATVPIAPPRETASPNSQLRTLHMKRDLAAKSRDALTNLLAAVRQLSRDSDASDLLSKAARDSGAIEQSLDSTSTAVRNMAATLAGMNKRMDNIRRSADELPTLLLYFDDMEKIGKSQSQS